MSYAKRQLIIVLQVRGNQDSGQGGAGGYLEISVPQGRHDCGSGGGWQISGVYA